MDLLAATIRAQRICHPKLHALHELWQAKRDARAMPSRGDFDWADLRPWFGNLILVDVIDDGADFHYRLWGSELAQLLGYELTGRRMSDVVSWLGPNPRDEYREVCRTRGVVSVLVRMPDADHIVRLHKLNLPLSCDGVRIDKVLAAIYPAERVRAAARDEAAA
jgi:hypothetical protein